jgi:hypothetical protein
MACAKVKEEAMQLSPAISILRIAVTDPFANRQILVDVSPRG